MPPPALRWPAGSTPASLTWSPRWRQAPSAPVALVRSDVSDTPGVAIATSLVPPVAVVGLTLESGQPHQASGALLLFLTNVAAILLMGLIVMAVYEVRAVAMRGHVGRQVSSRAATAIVIVAIGLLAIRWLRPPGNSRPRRLARAPSTRSPPPGPVHMAGRSSTSTHRIHRVGARYRPGSDPQPRVLPQGTQRPPDCKRSASTWNSTRSGKRTCADRPG
jgi:hypothetical protein